MNQAFEDLKVDIQTLIDTASDTIRQIVDDAASRARSETPLVSGGAFQSDGSEFTSQIEALRTKIRIAVDNLREQARSALDNPVFSTTGTQIGGTPPAPVGVNPGTAAQGNVDDQMPAGGSDQSPNTPVPPAPEFGGSTIGPDSFKAGA